MPFEHPPQPESRGVCVAVTRNYGGRILVLTQAVEFQGKEWCPALRGLGCAMARPKLGPVAHAVLDSSYLYRNRSKYKAPFPKPGEGKGGGMRSLWLCAIQEWRAEMKKRFVYKRKYAGMDVVQIRNDLRRQWMSDPMKHAAIQARAERVNLGNGRVKTLIRCAHCENLFTRDFIQAHHINPVGTLASNSRRDVECFADRLFVHKAEIQPVCIDCHKGITLAHRYAQSASEGVHHAR